MWFSVIHSSNQLAYLPVALRRGRIFSTSYMFNLRFTSAVVCVCRTDGCWIRRLGMFLAMPYAIRTVAVAPAECSGHFDWADGGYWLRSHRPEVCLRTRCALLFEETVLAWKWSCKQNRDWMVYVSIHSCKGVSCFLLHVCCLMFIQSFKVDACQVLTQISSHTIRTDQVPAAAYLLKQRCHNTQRRGPEYELSLSSGW